MWFLVLFCAWSGIQAERAVFMNQFAVHVPGGALLAEEVARRHGFTNLGQIGSLQDYYLLEHSRIHKRSTNQSREHHERLEQDSQVLWWAQQQEKRRLKRDGLVDWPGFISRAAATHLSFPDPLFKEEWYLNGGAKDGYDMNVGPAWSKGYTGKGVVVSILDDGIQTNHPDLAANYDPLASTDINDNDPDPMPRDNGDNKHGTRCAGEVAAVAHNHYCGVGVAYNASIGGVRMLDGSVNDAVEARALSLNPDHIDIYSASWGPEDDGKTVDGPGPLARRAFINGVTTGRRGKGSIFVWASGNGGRHTDSCNCDGYTNSIFTLSISSATQGGYKPWYLEECSSTLATTYSSGTPGHDKSIATVDMDGKLRPDHICTVEHTGTSASAPLAAGLCALALEANPDLTWRDMQHIVVMASNPQPLLKENGWITNGVNRRVSHKFGYGLMDGGKMVSLAEQWSSVPPQHICKSQELIEDRPIDSGYGSLLSVSVDATGCHGTVNEVQFVEHVQCKVSLRFLPRGNLRLVLTSPQGTPSTLLQERPRDVVSSNFDDWPFLSVHYWGENPRGRWTLQVINAGNRHVNQAGILRKWQLIFYGTATNPVRLRSESTNPFTFPAPSLPFFPSVTSQDIFSQSTFRDLPTLFAAAGTQEQKTYVKLNEVGKRPLVDQLPPLDHNEVESRCHESCEACAGPLQDACLTCSPNHFYLQDLGLCLQHCPEGYFEQLSEGGSGMCINCKGPCMSCPQGPEICSSCDHHLILHNNTCISSCPPAFFETNDYTCEACMEGCASCTSSMACLTCLPDGRAPSYGGTCPAPRCPPQCSACMTDDVCSACSNGYVLLDHTCVVSNTSCRPGERMVDGLGCQPCNSGRFCISCPQGLHFFNSSCIASCPDGWFSDRGWCKPCSDKCSECSGPGECLRCSAGASMFEGRCFDDCPQGTFLVSPGLCLKCHHFCFTCSGVGPYGCSSCAPGRYMDAAMRLCMPCRACNSSSSQADCCHCDPLTGMCRLGNSKRRLAVQLVDQKTTDSTLASTVAIVTAAVAVAALVFVIAQVKNRRSKNLGYTKVPIHEVYLTDPFNFKHTSLSASSRENVVS